MHEKTSEDASTEARQSHEFDTDTAVRATGEDKFTAALSNRWGVGPALNGGYGLATAARAIGFVLPQPHPLSITGHFLGTLVEGPADISVGVVKRGRSVSNGEVALYQDGRERLRVLGLFGDLADDRRPVLVDGTPPDLPPVSDCVGNEPGSPNPFGIAIADRFLYRVAPDEVGHFGGRPSGEAFTRAWIRFADGREPDLLGLVCVVDAFAPVVAEIGLAGWAPTLELTVHLRGHPAPGWLRVAIRTRFVQGGLFEEDAEVWDADDRLVAQSRQLAREPE